MASRRPRRVERRGLFVGAGQGREAALSCALLRPAPGPGPDWIEGQPCCRECGEEIPRARLAAVPGVGLCVECAG